jgi:hypothetical protein
MNVGIMAIEVAEAGLEPVRTLLEDEDPMALMPPRGVSEAQLEGHVETGHAEPAGAGQGDPAKVVHGGSALRQEIQDAIEAHPALRDL